MLKSYMYSQVIPMQFHAYVSLQRMKSILGATTVLLESGQSLEYYKTWRMKEFLIMVTHPHQMSDRKEERSHLQLVAAAEHQQRQKLQRERMENQQGEMVDRQLHCQSKIHCEV